MYSNEAAEKAAEAKEKEWAASDLLPVAEVQHIFDTDTL